VFMAIGHAAANHLASGFALCCGAAWRGDRSAIAVAARRRRTETDDRAFAAACSRLECLRWAWAGGRKHKETRGLAGGRSISGRQLGPTAGGWSRFVAPVNRIGLTRLQLACSFSFSKRRQKSLDRFHVLRAALDK